MPERGTAADLPGLLRRARQLQPFPPEKARLGRAVREGSISPDDVRWVYLAAELVEAVIGELDPDRTATAHRHHFGPVTFGRPLGPAHYEAEIGPCACGMNWQEYLVEAAATSIPGAASDDEPFCGRCRSYCNTTNALCPCCQSVGVWQRHSLAEDVMRLYEARIPGARQARLKDPQSSYAWEMLRNLLAITDAAMTDEGIETRVRQRVLAAVTYGGLNPADAEQRVREREQYARLFERTQAPQPFSMAEALAGRETDGPRHE